MSMEPSIKSKKLKDLLKIELTLEDLPTEELLAKFDTTRKIVEFYWANDAELVALRIVNELRSRGFSIRPNQKRVSLNLHKRVKVEMLYPNFFKGVPTPPPKSK
jgi:hypothetical protein